MRATGVQFTCFFLASAMQAVRLHRQQPHAAAARRRTAPAPLPTPSGGSLQRAADVGTRDDHLAALLADAVQRRATRAPLLQRAIIAINGPTDKAPAREITRNCLHNLTSTRARGDAAGPAAVENIAPPDLDRDESLYILGHGNQQVIADLTATQLSDAIIGWYGATDYRGKIKLVACSSGVRSTFTRSYADRLNRYLTRKATTSFRPESVDGVLGVAWVHERRGNILAIDDLAYDRQEEAGEDVEGAFAEPDPTTRRHELKRIFGKRDAHGSSVHTGKGTAKVRYYTNLPDQPPEPWTFMRVVRALVPCIP